MDMLPLVFKILPKAPQIRRLIEINTPAVQKVPPEAFPIFRQWWVLTQQLLRLLRPAYEQFKKTKPESMELIRDLMQTLVPEIFERWRRMPTAAITSDVRWVQEALNKLGASPQLTVDGDGGPATYKAIKDFQKSHGLTVDGDAGLITLAAIYTELTRT